MDAFASGEDGDGDDDPGVFGEDVADEEVDFVGRVGDGDSVAAALRGEEVGSLAETAGGFDLHADEAAAGVEDEIVAVAVAVGLGDGEAEAGGLEEEGEFGEFSAALGGALGSDTGAAGGLSNWLRIVMAHDANKKARAGLALNPS